MAARPYDAILRDVLEALERGTEPSFDEIAARHPGHADTVRRVLETVRRYERLRRHAQGRPLPPIEALEPGTRMGDFEIEDFLASGGMGAVYRARQLSLGGRRVALKVLAADTSAPHAILRFRREALALAGLHHPHLAEVHGYGEASGSLYFAMRLVEGPTLRDVLERRAIGRAMGDDPRDRRAIVERITEVADALAFAHDRGLVHRDLKPSNIVLEGAGAEDPLRRSAVLIDFGLARPRDADTLTRTGDSPATPSYASPEQLLGRDVDPRSDVFGLGVTLHDLLSARRPTERMQASAGLEPIREVAPAVDEDLAAIVSRAVDPEARWRYAHAGDLRDDLRAWLAGQPVSARRLPWGERVRRWIARHPQQIARVSALLAGVVAAGVLLSEPIRAHRWHQEARNALDRGDLRDLARLARAAPTWALGWIADDELEELIDRMRADRPVDPLCEVTRRLERNDMTRALVASATEIATDRADPVVERFFLACGTSEPTRAELRPQDSIAWSILAGRLFYERPVVDAATVERRAPFRRAILDAWHREDLPAEARRYLVTSLGGCGEIQDLESPLLAWASAPERTWEDVRLALVNAQRLVARWQRIARGDPMPLDRWWRGVRILAPRVREFEANAMPYGLDEALGNLCKTLSIVGRSVGAVPSDVDEIVPWGPLENDSDGHDGWWKFLAVARHPWLTGSLERPAPDRMRAIGPERLGWMARALGGSFADDLERWVREHGQPEDASDFASGVDRARLEFLGIDPSEDLDADTFFGTLPSDRSPKPLPGTWVDRIEGFESVALLPRLPSPDPEELSVLVGLPIEASWWCEGSEMRWSGLALAPLGCAVEVREESPENHHVRLGVFGASELVLPFDVPHGSAGADRVLLLVLQMNVRNAYPGTGRALLELAINDTFLEQQACTANSKTQRPVDLHARDLRTGRNELRIRLLDTSTTPLRVHSATLVPISKNVVPSGSPGR